MVTVLVVAVALVVGLFVGRATRPQPQPERKPSFGLSEAEMLQTKLGSPLTPELARVAYVSALVSGADFTVPQETAQAKTELASQTRGAVTRAEQLEAKAVAERRLAADTRHRAEEVTAVANVFAAAAGSIRPPNFALEGHFLGDCLRQL